MRKHLFIFIALGLISCNRSNLNGVYVAFEEICSTDSMGKKYCFTDHHTPARKWYHKCYLKIRGDSAFMDKNPVSIYKKDTANSASDGAFYYFKGKVSYRDDSIIVNFNNTTCHYCVQRVSLNPNGTRSVIKEGKILTGIKNDYGILLNGLFYTKLKTDSTLLSEHWEILE